MRTLTCGRLDQSAAATYRHPLPAAAPAATCCNLLLPAATCCDLPPPATTVVQGHPVSLATCSKELVCYLPLPSVTFRYLPLPTVTYRYLPLPSVTYYYLLKRVGLEDLKAVDIEDADERVNVLGFLLREALVDALD